MSAVAREGTQGESELMDIMTVLVGHFYRQFFKLLIFKNQI